MKKIILLAITVLMLTGCSMDVESRESIKYIQDYSYTNIHVDKETCIEYFMYYDIGLSVRYNTDGTIKLNKECLNEK